MTCVTADQEKNINTVMGEFNEGYIHVAVGVILNDNATEVFVSKRRPEQSFAGYWEFPGGKHEDNETPLESLIRELKEEIGINVINAKQFLKITHRYAERLVCLHVWLVDKFTGQPKGAEGQECRWVPISDLTQYQFPEGNHQIVQALLA